MDYLRIYTQLIETGKSRSPSKGLHKHRIIPGYDGGQYISENISLLTRKEHRLVHLLRYKIFGKHQDILAFFKLSGKTRGKNHKLFTQSPEWISKRIKKGVNKGMVSCVDSQGNFIKVSQEEFYNRTDLRGVNKGGYKLPKGSKTGKLNPAYGKPNKKLADLNKKYKGSRWYNNGIESKRFFDNEVTADWKRGRL